MNFISRIDAQGRLTGTLTAQFRSMGFPAFAGAPFSGEERRSSVQTLSDGTRIDSPAPPGSKIFRDSEGRTRMERAMGGITRPGDRGASPQFVLVEIDDTVEGYLYLLDSEHKIAYRSRYTPVPVRPVQTAPKPPVQTATPPPKEGMPQTTTESLGIRVIQGVQAEGQRQTTVYPVGFRGNDRPLTNVNETWTSPQLQLTVLTTSKSGTGETTLEIVNLSLLAPVADLFRVPLDYQVVDKQGTFTVEFSASQTTVPQTQGTGNRYHVEFSAPTTPSPGTQR